MYGKEHMKKILLVIAVVLLLGLVVGCKKDPVEELKYTVTFETSGGAIIANQEVLNGGKVTEPTDPTRDGYQFSGDWMNGTFDWDFAIDIVTENVTLIAGWIEISTTPTNISVTDELFSSTLVWQQTDAELQTFTVSIKPIDGSSYTVVAGSVAIEDTDLLDTVTFTPTVLPLGGYYLVKVVAGLETATSEQVLLGGAGTALNPYNVSQVSDILAILDDSSLADKHFSQVEDVLMTLTDPIEINNDRKISFSGVYDGNNKSLSFSGNGGLFHELTATGEVKNIVVDGATVLSAQEDNTYPIGTIADINNGLIENISSRAKLTNATLQGFLPVFAGVVDTIDQTTGAGGIVGINNAAGTISNVTVGGAGSVKAGRGVGGVSAYNHGLIEYATVTATLPAGNQANSGKSSNTYSFGGGISGFNFGTISHSVVSGRVFAQSAYSTTGDGNEDKNVAFGGIAGYNEGTITESSFARSMSSKEFIDKARAADLGDSANNLGVAAIHGDIYVGGIAGINAGTITDTYVGGALIAARDFVGGVAGLTLGTGSISNTYVFAEVCIKDDGGLKVTTANAKTTLSVYDIAPSGFDANTIFFRQLLNSNTSSTWAPGDFDAPMIPEFTTADLAIVGNKFAANGVLAWQQGTVTGVDIALDTIVITYLSTETLDYTITPSNAPDSFTVWTTSDDTVVEVLGDGVIKGLNPGTATITVTTRDGSFTDTIDVTVDIYTTIDTVTVTADSLTLPAVNNIDVRDDVEIDTVVVLTVNILPIDADYQGYTITTSNSRAVANGNTVTFVYGNTGPGKVSIKIIFDDASMAMLEYRFTTIPSTAGNISVDSAVVTAGTFTLPNVNDSEDRIPVARDVVATLTIDISPVNATNQNYTVITSNSRAEAIGNVVTFGTSTIGSVSIKILFEDTTFGVPYTDSDSGILYGMLEYRFTVIEPVAIDSVNITADTITVPEANNSDVRLPVDIGTIATFTVEILPTTATNQNYEVTTSNSRATVEGNVVTFVWGNTGPGSVSVYVTFEDAAIGELNHRFTTVGVYVASADITADVITLPEADNAADLANVAIDTAVTFTVDILPTDATNQNYTITSSSTSATVDGDVVTFVAGDGLGNVSITITFVDDTLAPLVYWFTTTN